MPTEFCGFDRQTLPVPEEFFNAVIAQENASVIKVVSSFLLRTLAGEEEIAASYSDIQGQTKLSRTGVASGLSGAIEAGYLILVQEGDGATAAIYKLSWLNQDQSEKKQSENNNGNNSIENHVEINIESEAQTVVLKPDHNIHTLSPCLPQNVDNPYLTALTRDFSRELGDLPHLKSNLSQTRNLWSKSGMSADEFAKLMYLSRELTRRYATFRPGEIPPKEGTPRNRMAYFYCVLREKLENKPIPEPLCPPAPIKTAATPKSWEQFRSKSGFAGGVIPSPFE
jgi:hypothetical protein